MEENQTRQAQIEGLATLLVLDEEIRKLTNIREFGFFSTNETHRLIPYHTAYLWQAKEFIGTHLVAQSGVAEIDLHAPGNQWLIRKINEVRVMPISKEIHQLSHEENPEIATDESVLDEEWPEGLPNYSLWCPLLDKAEKITGGLVFFRETAFVENEVKMLRWLIASYQYTWQVLTKPHKVPSWEKFKDRPHMIALGIIILGVLLFPIKLSVFGDGTVIPKAPVLINAPLQGVIKAFAVKPGDHVKAGQLLLTMDKTDLDASVEVSKKDYLLTEAKLRTAINQGFENKEVRSEIPILQAQLTIDKARLDYANELLTKTNIVSPIDGVVIFDSKEDWVGQPVRTGERILIVADLRQVELKITIPVANSIELAVGNQGEFFLYGQLKALPVKVESLGYNAKLMPDKVLAYQLTANFSDPTDLPQLGAQGTVKIYGHYVPIIYYLLRRPLQALRQTLGV